MLTAGGIVEGREIQPECCFARLHIPNLDGRHPQFRIGAADNDLSAIRRKCEIIDVQTGGVNELPHFFAGCHVPQARDPGEISAEQIASIWRKPQAILHEFILYKNPLELAGSTIPQLYSTPDSEPARGNRAAIRREGKRSGRSGVAIEYWQFRTRRNVP
jgi:hypothetical protein